MADGLDIGRLIAGIVKSPPGGSLGRSATRSRGVDLPLPPLPSDVGTHQAGQDLPLPGSPEAKPSSWLDSLKTIPGALLHGTAAIPGIVGDALTMKNAMGALGGPGVTMNLDAEDQARDQLGVPHSAASSVLNYHPLPGTQAWVNAADTGVGKVTGAATGTEYVPYRPQTGPGRITEAVASSLPSAFIGPEGLMTNLAKNAGTAAMSGLGAGTAREAFPDSPMATLIGGILGGIGGGVRSGANRYRGAPATAERAEQIAGQALRQGSLDPAADIASLGQFISDRPKLMTGMRPTTTQVLGTPEAQALEQQATSLAGKEPGVHTLDIAGTRRANRDLAFGATPEGSSRNMGDIVGEAIPEPDLPGAFGVEPGVQGEAATRGKDIVARAEQAYANAERRAWNDVGDDASLHGGPVMGRINDYFDNLGVVQSKAFPADVRGLVTALREHYGAQQLTGSPSRTAGGIKYTYDPARETWFDVEGRPPSRMVSQALTESFNTSSGKEMPLAELQDLRRNVLSKGRAAFRSGDNATGSLLYDFAGTLAGELEDSANYAFRGNEAPPAWREAVTATRRHRENFGSGFASDLLAESTPGNPKIAAEATFDKMFGGGTNSINNLRRVRSVEGIDLPEFDNAVGDWVIGKLTGNGTNFKLTQDALAAKLADPKIASIVNEVPSLKARVADLSQAAGESDEAYALRSAANGLKELLNTSNPNPTKLANYIEGNRDTLLQTINPENRGFLDQLHQSAKMVEDIPQAAALPNESTINTLRNGNLLTLLYGKATGRISDAAAFGVMGEALHQVRSIFGSHLEPILGAAFGLAHGANNSFARRIGDFVLGDTRAQSIDMLQRAMNDPALAHALMQKPTPESIMSLLTNGGARITAATALANKTRSQTPVPQEPQSDHHDVTDMPIDQPVDMPEDDSSLQRDISVPMDALTPEPTEGSVGRWTGGRTAYRDGGSVTDIEPLIGRLMMRAHHARKASNEATEPLLNSHDDAIANALAVAQKAL